MSYRDRASFGRRLEFSIFAELLRRDFDVYQTLVDDQGIDCVIRLDAERYIDVQIKARSTTAEQSTLFAGMAFEPRDNLFFIFYTESNDTCWVMPSWEAAALGSVNLHGKNVGKISLSLPASSTSGQSSLFEKYKNDSGFNLLRQFNMPPTDSKATEEQSQLD